MVGSNATIKFLCCYGGKIVPRYPDGKLRYHGGETRVLAVDRSVTFSELLMKFGEMCGAAVCVRCQLPAEDLDALVTITSDEDLANLIEEYDRVASPPSSLKIRAFLLPKSAKKSTSPPSSSASSSNPKSSASSTPRYSCVHQISPPLMASPHYYTKSAGKAPQYCYHTQYRGSGRVYFIHNGNH